MISTVNISTGPNSAKPQANVACKEVTGLLSLTLKVFLVALWLDPGVFFIGYHIFPVTLWRVPIICVESVSLH